MAFPTSPSNLDLHIEGTVTWQFNSAKNRWSIFDSADATELNLDSESHDRKASDSDIHVINKRMHDSDRHDFKAADSDLGTGYLSHISRQGPGTDLFNGNTGVNWFFNGADGGLRGNGLYGFRQAEGANNIKIGATVVDANGTNVDAVVMIRSSTNTNINVLWIRDGIFVGLEYGANADRDYETFNNFAFHPDENGTTYERGTLQFTWTSTGSALNETRYYSIIDYPLIPQLNVDSEYSTTEERDRKISRSLENLYFLSNGSKEDSLLETHDRKAADSDLSDRTTLEVHERKAADSDLSDRITLEVHNRKAADSDLSDRISEHDSDIAILFQRTDSDNLVLQTLETTMVLRIDSERHDWKASDSDLSDRITANDSDIAYLYDVTVKFRGTIDPTVDQPHHTEIKAGDVYVSTTGGRIVSGWNGVEELDVKIGDALLYTDSDVWTFLGSGSDNHKSIRFIEPGVTEVYDTVPTGIQITLVSNSDTSTGLGHNTILALSTDTLFPSEENFWLSRTLGPLGGGVYQHEAWVVMGGKEVWKVVNFQNASSTYTVHNDGDWEYTRLGDTGQNVNYTNYANGNSFANAGTLDVYKFERESLKFTKSEKENVEQVVHDSDIVFNFSWLFDQIVDKDSDLHDLKAFDSDLDKVKSGLLFDSEINHFKPTYDGNLTFTTSGGAITGATINSPVGGAWFTITANIIFPDVTTDTVIIIRDNEFVTAFTDNGFTTQTYKSNGFTYTRQPQRNPLPSITVNTTATPATTIASPFQLGISSGQKGYELNERGTVTREDFDSDILRNFRFIAGALSDLDSDRPETEDKFVPYINDSEIEVGVVRFTNDDTLGTIRWNDTDKTFDMGLEFGVTLQAGQEMHFMGKATEAISNGDVVMFAGAQGEHFLMSKADTSVAGFKPEWIMGVATHDISSNQFGYVTQIGQVREVDTSNFTQGSLLYLDHDISGRLLDSEPSYPYHSILVAAVTRSHATEGSVYVRISHKPDISELHNVTITEPPAGEKDKHVIMWDSDTNNWVNAAIDTDYGTF